MPETLPGNPTDAGPDIRANQPPPSWDEFLMYAEDELKQARRLRRDSRSDERRLQIAAIERAEQFLADAKEQLRRLL